MSASLPVQGGIATRAKFKPEIRQANASVELIPGASYQDATEVIRAAYRQVFGNAHIMESERVVVAESRLRFGKISVREFVRSLAKSNLYRSRFFDACSRYRSIELNFKHLLGRAPESFDEMKLHSQILDRDGYEADIDSFIDSDEYHSAFGENTVPYYQGYSSRTGQRLLGFTNMLEMLPSLSSSDRDLTGDNQPRVANKSILFYDNPAGQAKPVDVRSLIREALGTPRSAFATKSGQLRPAQNWKVTSQIAEQDALAEKLRRQRPDRAKFKPEIRRQANAFVELIPGAPYQDATEVIRAAYRQVFGNAHIMESERVVVAESRLRSGEISVREFVRSLAKSNLYRSRFFDACSRYRSIELNFKHLLGRAPESFDEMKLHSQILDRDGYEADIDSFIDSDEYQSVFGENTVPYYQGYSSRTGQRLLGFTNMLEMLPSLSSSDRDLTGDNQPRVAKSILYDNPAGQAKPVDVRSLIREALSTPRPAIATKSDQLLPAENQKVTSQIAEQDALIEKLRRQLSEVSPFAAVGMSIIGTYSNSGQEGNAVYGGSGNSFGVSENTSSIAQARTQDLNTILEQKTAQAKRLQDQLQDAQRMAVVGSAKANRWRRNTFSS